jgi:hypothetical protein
MAERKLCQTEKDHNKEAFELYYAMGQKRSQIAIAKKLGVSLSTIKNWSRSFQWRKRIAERDAQVAREIANRTITDEMSRRTRNLQIVDMSIINLAKAIAQGKVKFMLGDLDKLIRLEAFLCDEPDTRHEVMISDLKNKTNEELHEMIVEEIEILKRLDLSEPEVKLLPGGDDQSS